jgi:hypothetical protein
VPERRNEKLKEYKYQKKNNAKDNLENSRTSNLQFLSNYNVDDASKIRYLGSL